MFPGSGVPPEKFISDVVRGYHLEKKSVSELAKSYGVSEAVVRRVLKHYDGVFEKNSAPVTKSAKVRASKIVELKDITRRQKGKLTQEDLDDLLIDLKLFEKGKEPGEEKDGA